MTFIEHLIREHRELEKWVKTIREADEQNATEEDRKAMFQQLHVHMKMEEEFLFPRLKKELSEEEEIELIEDSHKEHSELKDIIIKFLGDDTLGKEEANLLLECLLERLEHHHKDEETELFPMCRERISSSRMEKITREMADFEKEHTDQFLPDVSDEVSDSERNKKEAAEKKERKAMSAEPGSDAASIGTEPVTPGSAKIGG